MKRGAIAFLMLLCTHLPLAWGQVPVPSPYGLIQVSVVETKPSLPDEVKSVEPLPDAHIPGAEEVAEENLVKPRQFWLRSEYLLWGIKDSHYPPLLTLAPFPTTAARPGALGQDGTAVVFGGSDMSNKDRNGGRFFAGCWLGGEEQIGLEVGYFFLATRSVGTFITSTGNPILARPFFNANLGIQDSSLDAYPGLASGGVKIDVPSFLQGAESNLISVLIQRPQFRLEALAGFRYLNLQEGLHIAEDVQTFTGDLIHVSDRFNTETNFYGGQVGARSEFRYRRWSVGVITKVALGDSSQAVDIRGFSQGTSPAFFANGGLLALPSNIGHFTRDNFAVVPEVGGNLGFQFTQSLRGFVGYSFLYWTQVARPGDQVDTVVNVNQVPTSTTFGTPGGPNRPAFIFHSTDFYAHGVNFGLEFRF
jgi:hypothetical protein